MKKRMIILCVSMIFLLSGCGSKDDSYTSKNTTVIDDVTTIESYTKDNSKEEDTTTEKVAETQEITDIRVTVEILDMSSSEIQTTEGDDTTAEDNTTIEEYTTTVKQTEAETTTKKSKETTTVKRTEAETTTKKPKETTTVKQTEAETTTKKPKETTTVKQTEAETTTKKPKETTTVKQTEAETTTKKPKETTTVKQTEAETTTKKQVETTTKQPETITQEETTTRYVVNTEEESSESVSNVKYGVTKNVVKYVVYNVYSDGSREIKQEYENFSSYDYSGYNATDEELKQEVSDNVTAFMSYYEEVLVLVNEIRAEAGVEPLVLDVELCKAATMRSVEMDYTNTFEHARPFGRDWSTVLDTYNISWSGCGENIAAGYSSPQAVVNGWKNSPGHYANMINSNFTKLGVGLSNAGTGYYGKYWTQLFVK